MLYFAEIDNLIYSIKTFILEIKNIFSDDKLVNYYKEDFDLYSKATKYVIPKVSKLFKNF